MTEMFDFKIQSSSEFSFSVDLNIYSDPVISKVLYWLSDSFYISRKSVDTHTHFILLQAKDDIGLRPDEISELKKRLSQDFIDYKTREIIREETSAIRNILYIKAFSNCDDFDEIPPEEE